MSLFVTRLSDRFDDVVEFRVTHMGVDLCFVGHAVGCNAERFYGPVKILAPLGSTQHASISQVKDLFGDDVYRSYFKFTIERNPWDRQLVWRAA